MDKRKLGRSEVYVTPIIFGAWAIGGWMWGGNDRKDSLKALRESFEIGITTIDTAPAYGFGLSEEIIGEVIRGRRNKFQILTKCGLRWDRKSGKYYFATKDNEGRNIAIYKYSGKESLIEECENSLKRLGTDYIDLFQIHWPDITTPAEEAMEALNILLTKGKIRAAGVSNYSREETETALKYTCLCSNQVPYSMVNRGIEKDLVPWCIKNKVSILAYSPLQRGLLTGKYRPSHKFKEGDSRPFTQFYKPVNIERINLFLDELKPLAKEKKVSLSQLVLRWTLEQPGITGVLAGARNPEQIKENAGALNIDFNNDEMAMINSKINSLVLDV